MTAKKVVSLLSSATEILVALGCEDRLVGRSHECDYPPSILSLPQCSRPRIDISGTSREIDERVRQAAHNGLSLYDVDSSMLQHLRPDVILTQTQCEVCAVSLQDVERAVCNLLDAPASIVSVHPESLADLWADIRQVARALDIAPRGEILITRLQERLESLKSQTAGLQRPRVACLEWLDPLMAAGNWVPDLVDLAGGLNLLGTSGQHSPWMTWEELVAAAPEVIVAMPCGWGIRKALDELRPLTNHPCWNTLPAVQSGRIYVTDGNQYFNRPGPRLVESAEILAEIFHPDRFDFGHRLNGAWQTVE